MNRIVPLLVSVCLCLAMPLANAAADELQYFPLSNVRLLDSPFRHAQEKDIDYILALEPDRLLAPFLREAGLEPKAAPYGNWESGGLDGHIGGHYLTALSLGYAATGREVLKERLDYMVGELARVQAAHGNGYIGGVPDAEKLWKALKKGHIEAGNHSLNNYWVPWYNLHKTFAGLRDAYLYTGNESARELFLTLSDWALGVIGKLDDDQMETMLTTEYGGMNDVLADAYAISGEEKYLTGAKRFSQKQLLQPLMHRQDVLNGLHANTQIPKVIGFARVAELDGDTNWMQAADYFWSTVANQRSVAIGGNSVREHFHTKTDFSPMVEEVQGPETCNTYNMLKLSRLLYARSGDVDYIDFYERALYNHILSSQHPETGGLVYFTSMRPQHYRVYSTVENAMWCCVGSGIENHVKYGEMIYAHTDDSLYVNLWIPSRLEWPEKKTAVRLQTDFPVGEGVALTVEKPARFSLKLRYPQWVREKAFEIRVNGRRLQAKANNGYLAISRAWEAGDTVTFNLPTAVTAEQLPDGQNYYAILYGPVVLAARTNPFKNEQLDFFADDSRMGHVASGKMCPLPDAPRSVSKTPDFYKKIERLSETSLTFSVPESLHYNGERPVVLEPFYNIHESRYTVYFPYRTPENDARLQQLQEEKEAERLALEAKTVDQVAPGEQQPEKEHDFQGEVTWTGVQGDRHWRESKAWFSYTLADPKGRARALRVAYIGGDGGRTFDIEINGEKLTTVTLKDDAGAAFFTEDYKLTGAMKKADNGALNIKFTAHPGSATGKIAGVRLLSQ